MMAALAGKRCLVTGASSGIGEASARVLAGLGAELILVARDRGRGEAALVGVEAVLSSGQARPSLELADLASLAETAALAGRVAKRGPLDVLVNCAGQYLTRRILTAEGLETQFAVNHLAPFVLTTGLLSALSESSDPRVITVSSASHRGARIHWRDPSFERFYLGLRAYGQSKLANVLFMAELARRLGTGLTGFTLDPGLVNTGMGNKGGPSPSSLLWGLRRRSGTTPEVPARVVAWLASDPALRGRTGLYWKDGEALLPSERARDGGEARRLWDYSVGLVEAVLGRAGTGGRAGAPTGSPRPSA